MSETLRSARKTSSRSVGLTRPISSLTAVVNNRNVGFEVVGLTDRSWIAFADPHTESLRLIERYRRIDFGNMEIGLTVDDPKTYVKPWTVKARLKLSPDTELLEDVCENEKDQQHLVGK